MHREWQRANVRATCRKYLSSLQKRVKKLNLEQQLLNLLFGMHLKESIAIPPRSGR